MSEFVSLVIGEVMLDTDEVIKKIDADDLIRECFFSHPVATIKTFIELGNEDKPNMGREEAREMLELIDSLRTMLAFAAENGDEP